MKYKNLFTGLIVTTLVAVLVWMGIRLRHCSSAVSDEYGEEDEGEERLEVKVQLE
jgi:hypothetical protein